MCSRHINNTSKNFRRINYLQLQIEKKKEKVKPVNTTRPKRLVKQLVCYHERFRYIDGLFRVFYYYWSEGYGS